MEPLKHECGIAFIRLRKPLEYFRHRYGSYTYALDRLYLLMEKQHNRGQEGAGVGVIKLDAPAGYDYAFRERALGTGAIDEIFQTIGRSMPADVNRLSPTEIATEAPALGDIYMGHLRYSTTGRSGLQYTHPFLRRNNWRGRALMLCGNFNMTNVESIFKSIVATGQHPRLFSDTVLLLEQLGAALDKENHRQYRLFRDSLADPELAETVARNMDMTQVLQSVAPAWDGGYAMVGATGAGHSFVFRDPSGIRPAFYYADDEVVVVASERPVIQTVFNVPLESVHELEPGTAIICDQEGTPRIERILVPGPDARCSFERIYFSRGSDADIYRERKRLGAEIAGQVLEAIGRDLDHSVFSFIPNTAEIAHNGMVEELTRRVDQWRLEEIGRMLSQGDKDEARLAEILARRVRTEKVAIKDIKLRTFIAEANSRNDLAAHVYDITYGTIVPGEDRLVVLDDSIVRGTTLTRSILRIMDRLKPTEIVVVSSSPQVRYPDFYGIDLPALEELAAFRALVSLLLRDGRRAELENAYRDALKENESDAPAKNVVQGLYALYSDHEISDEMARMLTPEQIGAGVKLIFQTLEGLHRAVPASPGDWYFSGNYPTPGGIRLVNKSFIDFFEKKLCVKC